MTGFAEVSGEVDGDAWTWVIRSVNGKGFDLRARLPNGLDALEPELRRAARTRFARGNLQVSLLLERGAQAGALRVNEAALAQVVAIARAAAAKHGLDMPDIGRLLNMRGVLETAAGAQLSEATTAAVRASFEEALDALVRERDGEGARLEAVLTEQVNQIEALGEAARTDPSRSAAAVRERLRAQMALLAADDAIDDDRLHQEAAMLAVKADLSEELDRLRAHVAAARDLLASSEPVGRRLEFLAQEFNREANTLCAKSNAVAVTAIGLELKLVIDRLREQVANVQ